MTCVREAPSLILEARAVVSGWLATMQTQSEWPLSPRRWKVGGRAARVLSRPFCVFPSAYPVYDTLID